ETQGRRVLVFGDMLELGGEAEQAHREIGRYAARSGVDWMVTVGRMAALTAEEAGAAGVPTDSFADVGPAIEALREGLAEGDIVLVKASRGMALERVVEAIRDDR
ncbi:MAG TPA: UDP-N-acetylmuramoyl-tripeptide--D-alanyl-D-alanine ligase, partial [Armatimonadota bacterium]|nr:UDP-N-acetylmuramoyl-tripeptide--D-alanyl-D-alanine ligase [Armatimonadota bacterium]